MRHAWRYIAIGIAVYIPILLVTFPVAHLTGAIERQVDGLSIEAVTGSVFAGQAGRLRYQANELGPVSWRFSPTGLLRGRLEYRLELKHPDYHGHASLGITPGGALVGHDIDMQLQADRILNAFSPIALTSTGRLTLQLDTFAWRDNKPQDVSGLLDWQAAELRSPLQLQLGDLQLVLESAGDELVARIIRGGTLGASGDITLVPDGRFTVSVLLKPGPGVDANTRGLLETVAQLQPRGDYLIRTTGRL